MDHCNLVPGWYTIIRLGVFVIPDSLSIYMSLVCESSMNGKGLATNSHQLISTTYTITPKLPSS